MKTVKLILKGLLLFVTVLAIPLFMAGVESIYDNGWFFHGLIICIALCYACYKLISIEELDILTLNKWFNNITKEEK